MRFYPADRGELAAVHGLHVPGLLVVSASPVSGVERPRVVAGHEVRQEQLLRLAEFLELVLFVGQPERIGVVTPQVVRVHRDVDVVHRNEPGEPHPALRFDHEVGDLPGVAVDDHGFHLAGELVLEKASIASDHEHHLCHSRPPPLRQTVARTRPAAVPSEPPRRSVLAGLGPVGCTPAVRPKPDRAASRTWCTTPARSSRTESRSTSSFSPAASATTVWSASYRARLNRRSTARHLHRRVTGLLMESGQTAGALQQAIYNQTLTDQPQWSPPSDGGSTASRNPGRLTCANRSSRERSWPGGVRGPPDGLVKVQNAPLTCTRALPDC